jgi:class 3 adenylate cyclase
MVDSESIGIGPIDSRTPVFLFTDVVGSARLWNKHPEAMSLALRQHDEILRSSIAAHRGILFTSAGDSFAAAFPDVADAVAAALEARTRMAKAEWGEVGRLGVRYAVHKGLAEFRDGDYLGPEVNRCAGLLEIADADMVVVSATVAADLHDDLLLEELREAVLDGFESPELVYTIGTGI